MSRTWNPDDPPSKGIPCSAVAATLVICLLPGMLVVALIVPTAGLMMAGGLLAIAAMIAGARVATMIERNHPPTPVDRPEPVWTGTHDRDAILDAVLPRHTPN
jgi:hypothetical protein